MLIVGFVPETTAKLRSIVSIHLISVKYFQEHTQRGYRSCLQWSKWMCSATAESYSTPVKGLTSISDSADLPSGE